MDSAKRISVCVINEFPEIPHQVYFGSTGQLSLRQCNLCMFWLMIAFVPFYDGVQYPLSRA